MGYIIIELEIKKLENFNYAEFDAKEYEKANNVTLVGEPKLIEKTANKIILTYEGKNEDRKPRSFSVSG